MADISNDKEFKRNKMVQYFTSKERIDKSDPNFKSAIKLEKMVVAYYSDLTDIEKYLIFKELYISSKSFLKEYKMLKVYNSSTIVNYLDGYVEVIGEFAKEMENTISVEIEREYKRYKNNGFADDYKYAYNFVKSYIEYQESPYIVDFLKSVGLNENDFKRFVSIIYELDEKLYEKYLEKYTENKKIRKAETLIKVDNIHNLLMNEEIFDAVEFYKNLPFSDFETANEVIEDFGLKKLSSIDQKLKTILGNFYPDDLKVMCKSIYDKGLITRDLNRISEHEIRNMNYMKNDVVLTSQMKEDIVNYMKKENLPFLVVVYNAVRNKCLENGLDNDKTLIKRNMK